jgi:anti-sigma regulatory factor (Ser/Thr protein kinase)
MNNPDICRHVRIPAILQNPLPQESAHVAAPVEAPQPTTRLYVKVYPVPQSAGIARTFVRHHLLAFGLPELIGDACTIVTELVTNAIRETPNHDVAVYLSPQDGHPLLEVWDSSTTAPYLAAEDLFAESGRGLRIVKALSADCGYRILANGKIIWARLK